jgi:hypothetical protein
MGAIKMSGQLFAAIRRGKVKPGMADEFAKRVKAGALPVMQKMDGFKGYYLVVGADDTIIAVSLFTNKAVAQSSTQTLMPWIKENLGPLLASPTEAIDGTVVVSAWQRKVAALVGSPFSYFDLHAMSPFGTSRHFAAPQKSVAIGCIADKQGQLALPASAAFDPERTK